MVNYKTQTNKRRWELSYSPKEKFYLTDNEKNEFIKQILAGRDVICINDIVLTRFFKYIAPVVLSGTDYLLSEAQGD